jgi:hypothetical protein
MFRWGKPFINGPSVVQQIVSWDDPTNTPILEVKPCINSERLRTILINKLRVFTNPTYLETLHTDVSLLFENVERYLCNPICSFNRVR